MHNFSAKCRTILPNCTINAFFLVIQSDFLSRPHHAPFLPSVRLKIIQFTGTSFCWIRGVSLLHGCRLPISRSLGEKAGPGPAREKNPFFLRSHAVQLARVSPLLETLRLRPQTLHQRYVPKLRNYWIVTKMGGLGGRRRMPPRPSSHPALISLLECFPLLAPSRAATPLCPENGRFHSTSI